MGRFSYLPRETTIEHKHKQTQPQTNKLLNGESQLQSTKNGGCFDRHLRLLAYRNLLHLPDSIPYSLLGRSQQVYLLLHLLQATPHVFQLLLINAVLCHVVVGLFQKPDCLVHAGQEAP